MNEQPTYKSPLKKLVRFFKKSRDDWKAKHHERKKENKRLKHKIHTLLGSRKKWKEETQNLRKQLKKMTATMERATLEDTKKNTEHSS